MRTLPSRIIALGILALGCRDVTAPVQESWCPVSFEWSYLVSAWDYSQQSLDVLDNTFRLTLMHDSIAIGDGRLRYAFEYRVGADADTLPTLVLAPFESRYTLRDSQLVLSSNGTWLSRSDVVTQVQPDGTLLTYCTDPNASLRLEWRRC